MRNKSVEQLRSLAQMGYSSFYFGNESGDDYLLERVHKGYKAQKSAAVINQLHPTMVYASELTLFPDTPLSQDVRNGTFAEATETERMEEMREFVADLTVPTVFVAEHVTIPERVSGRLPEERDRLLAQLDRMTADARAGKLDHFREFVMGL